MFCEKPPVTNIKELNQLKNLNTGKIYFNFNQRFSSTGEIFKKIKKFNLGDLVYATVINSHGLAFKKEYKFSWRSNLKNVKKEFMKLFPFMILTY